MQVKKFEARSMKEALEMVKTHLGPDAIILSARDNQRSFGLVGEGSVEITAAVSEETLQKKKFAESRLREQDREKFLKSSARMQRELIEKMVTKHVEKNAAPKPITTRRYADIDDEFANEEPVRLRQRTEAPRAQVYSPAAVAPKVAAKAAIAGVPLAQAQAAIAASNGAETEVIRSLKGEIESLKGILAGFQEMSSQPVAGTHPGADYGIPYELAFMFEKLTGAGVHEEVAAEILNEAQNSLPAPKLKKKPLVDGWVARNILERTKVTGDRLGGKVHVFVGPSGSGKSTALVKWASHLVVNEKKKIAVVTTDTRKVGATDQMRIFAQILNVPFAIVRSAADWAHLMKYMAQLDAVLVDAPGLSLRAGEDIDALRALMPPASLNPRIHLTMSATAKDADIVETARRYSLIGFDDAVFTGLDESVQHGQILNFVHNFAKPLFAFGIGSRVPEDFEFASPERVLDLIFKITQSQSRETEAV